MFDVASLSKIFTATAALKLYEEGHFKRIAATEFQQRLNEVLFGVKFILKL
ncbi:serine hydrolase [Halobacillus seohaensis]|uniref:Serine hydrolase n=1 Tax=Halobacillus seohaensis TaxID=447421 RepID=A0ABW2EI76_9BACI